MRTGQDYASGLRDGRRVHIDGEVVRDVTTHPAFREAVRTVMSLYDAAADQAHAAVMRRYSPDVDAEVNTAWLVPRSVEDLEARRRAHAAWQERTFGLMGRTPDHVAAFLAAFAGRADVFGRGGRRFEVNVRDYYRRAATADLYLAYTIIPPQGDRSRPAHQQQNPHLYAGVVSERDDGIVLRGAQGIGTGAVLSDAFFLSSIVPLRPGDESYAISVVIPTGAEGVAIHPRRSFATSGRHVFDYPLSSRFDETDSMVVLHDVFVPWEHVFVYRDLELLQAQFFETPAHTMGNFQALVRLSTKLQFLVGLARRVCDAHGSSALPPVQSQLGQLAAYAAIVESTTAAAAAHPVIDEHGVASPDPQAVNAALVLQPQIVNNATMLLRELVGAGPIAMPSSSEVFASEAADDIATYYQSGSSSAEDRVKLLKLTWDFLGSEFGGRQMQYELFYAGAPFITQSRNYRVYDWDRCLALVDACLSGYHLEVGDRELLAP